MGIYFWGRTHEKACAEPWFHTLRSEENVYRHGWPLTYVCREMDPVDWANGEYRVWAITESVMEFRPSVLAVDLFIALLVIVGCTAAFEARRRRYARLLQFRLTELLMLMLVLACLFGWARSIYEQRQRESKAVTALEDRFGDVHLEPIGLPFVPHLPVVEDFSALERPVAITLGTKKWGREISDMFAGQSESLKDEELKAIGQLTALRFLDVSGTQLTDVGLAQFGNLTSLEWLCLADTRVTDKGLALLTRMTRLTTLELDGTAVTDAGLRYLALLDRLVLLDLGNTQITGEGLRELAGLDHLRMLYLPETRIKDADLAHLAEMDSLEEIDLSKTPITDAGLVHLASITNLDYLDLSDTRVTDAGLAEIGQLAGLKTLDLSGTSITDVGLTELKPLGGLRQLVVNHTQVTKEGVCRLRAAVPNVEVIYGDGYTYEEERGQ